QIVVLDLGGTQINDGIFDKLTSLPYLTTLKLDNTSISGNGIAHLSQLEHLKSINLTHSNFESSFIPFLNDFKKLEKVFLYKTKASQGAEKDPNQDSSILDFGNYTLPIIAQDSIIY
ncbi:MAG: hypothetical protein AB3N10_01545, partial [Allomuricauda sp.]